jgi:hypothetical protein
MRTARSTASAARSSSLVFAAKPTLGTSRTPPSQQRLDSGLVLRCVVLKGARKDGDNFGESFRIAADTCAPFLLPRWELGNWISAPFFPHI